MIDLKEVSVAWFRSFNPTPEQKATADERLAICEACPEAKVNQLNIHYFGACGCPLNKKIFSPKGPSACPQQKWPH